ncbi:gliding motility protein RemB [Pedobacter sp. Du54]|uniref:gliding motility protein RemB n=1 Tax=Pedobacter anseongensis TaxID=3133439 RepID=UPI0030A7C411
MKKILVLLLSVLSFSATAQDILPYSFRQYQKLNKSLYNQNTRFHTSLKPVLNHDSLITHQLDSLLNAPRTYTTWIERKLFSEHLVEVNKKDFNFYLDYLPDLLIGKDIDHDIKTWTNTRGYQLGGKIGKQLSFYASGFENQARFNNYLTQYIYDKGVIPGMMNDRGRDAELGPANVKEWTYSTAILNYTPNKYFSFTLAHDKNFIGDGYRSMVLSDVASAYPSFKIATTLGNVKYLAMWAQFQDPLSPQFSYDSGFRKKWGVFHYLDWNVNNRLSLGFFDSVIWQEADSVGTRGFDVSYLNPIVFLRTIESMNHSPDNALLGLTGKYKLLKNMTVYGQLVLDEFTLSKVLRGKGDWVNKFAYQLGFKGFDAFKVKNLTYLAEFNTARPFTYSQRTSLLNYGHYVEALAHPLGANFREFLSIWEYEFKRFSVYAQGTYARYGLDLNGETYGKDINRPYGDRLREDGYYTTNGLTTSLTYADVRISYLINPKYNLRLELGGISRTEKNALGSDRTKQITFGLRSTFRNIYQDF